MADIDNPYPYLTPGNSIQQLLLGLSPNQPPMAGGAPPGPSMDRQMAMDTLRTQLNQRFPQGAPAPLSRALGFAPGMEGVLPDTSPLTQPGTDQNFRTPAGSPQPSAPNAGPTTGVVPLRMPTAVPPPALPAPQAAQTPGATPQAASDRDETEQTPETPDVAREKGPDNGEGRPADRAQPPGGKVAKPQDNLAGLAKALSGIQPPKAPQGPPVVSPHVPTATAPHPAAPGRGTVQVQGLPMLQGALNKQAAMRTLGELLRGR